MKIKRADGSESSDIGDLVAGGAILQCANGITYEIPKPDKIVLEYAIGNNIYRSITIDRDHVEIAEDGLKIVDEDLEVTL